jgi:acetoin utilization deacetylase AcuC-like enzyme
MTQTGFVYHEAYLKHDTGPHHPERAQRLISILEAVEDAGLFDKLLRIDPLPAERSVLEFCHEHGYIDTFKDRVENALPYLHTPECPVSPTTFEAALCAVGGVLEGVDKVMEGRVRNCFCAVRPPGHHAERNRAMGFCYLNNVAIGARYLQKQYGVERVLILDWDVHHGNGIQNIFYKDPTVFYVSLHQDPSSCCPGTGWALETGEGKGKGYTLNLPMPPGAGNTEYLEAMEVVEQAMEAFKPEFVLISAGFDAHMDDPLAHVKLTRNGYEDLTRRVMNIAGEYAGGRLVSALEGGYNLKALGESVQTHIQVLMEEKK